MKRTENRRIVNGALPWPFARRFMRRIIKTPTGCWDWQGCKMGNGYGQLGVGGRHYAAHRYAYEQLVGPIPEGLDLDHLCRNRACANPAHLEPVTRKENLRRGDHWGGRHNLVKTHCPHGHPYDEANTYRNKTTGKRCCRACARITQQRIREARRG